MNITEVSCQQALESLETGDATFVDIRDPYSYISGHIPGAINIGNHNMEEFLSTSDPAKPVIVYCYHGISSRSAAAHLMHHGFQEVASMAGGFAAWGDAPCEQGTMPDTEPPAPSRSAAAPDAGDAQPKGDDEERPPRRRELFRRIRNLLKP